MNNSPFLSIFLLILLTIWVNIVLLQDKENVFELQSSFLANDSTVVTFSELPNFIVCEYNGKIRKTDNMSEFIKFKKAIETNDTIYYYYRYKGLIPLINWPLVKAGERLSTEIQ